MRSPLVCLLVSWWLADLAGLSWLDQHPAVHPAEHGSPCHMLGSSLLHMDSCWGPGWRARSSSHDDGEDARGKAQLHKHLSKSCPHLMDKAHHTTNIRGEEVGSVSSNRNCTLTWQASSHVKSEAREEWKIGATHRSILFLLTLFYWPLCE